MSERERERDRDTHKVKYSERDTEGDREIERNALVAHGHWTHLMHFNRISQFLDSAPIVSIIK